MVTQSHPQPHYQHPVPPQPMPRQPRRKRPRQNNTVRYLVIGGVVTFVGGMLLLVMGGLFGVFYLMTNNIPAGVAVAGVNVGEMAPDAARTQIMNTLNRQTIQVSDGARSATAAPADLGIRYDYNAMFAQMKTASANTTIPAAYTLDVNTMQAALIGLSEQINVDVGPGEAGRVMDIPGNMERLRTNTAAEIGDGVFDLTMIDIDPLPIASNNFNGEPATHIVEEGQELALIAKQYAVSVENVLELNEISNPDVIYVGQELKIPASGVYTPTAADAPPAPLQQGKSIVVATDEQWIYAYEDGELIRSQIVSTGRAETPTVKGDFNIYIKYAADDMSGPGYFVPQVPWTMYYYQGYAIHGAYWHNSFGRPMSHGCVNLPVDEARWFYEWAEKGTLVRVI